MPPVLGIDVDGQARCAHDLSAVDVVAIKMRCCGQGYACITCHEAVATHAPEVWQALEWNERAALCGMCRAELTTREYLECGSLCPRCYASFSPRCALPRHLYFDLPRA